MARLAHFVALMWMNLGKLIAVVSGVSAVSGCSSEYEGRDVVQEHYGDRLLSIEEARPLYPFGGPEHPAQQICYRLRITSADGRSEQEVFPLVGYWHHDNPFEFAGEFKSMEECLKNVDRG